MPFPKSKQDLQHSLGMIAYLSKFILQLSEQTHQLRELVKKNPIWDFIITHRNQFDKLNSMISENIFLNFFQPEVTNKNYLWLIQIQNGCKFWTKTWEQLASCSFQIEDIHLCRTKLLSFRKKDINYCFCLFEIQWVSVWQKSYCKKWS